MIIQWIKEKLLCRTRKTRHNVIKLTWQKAELEQLLARKDSMTPEEFRRAYQRLVAEK